MDIKTDIYPVFYSSTYWACAALGKVLEWFCFSVLCVECLLSKSRTETLKIDSGGRMAGRAQTLSKCVHLNHICIQTCAWIAPARFWVNVCTWTVHVCKHVHVWYMQGSDPWNLHHFSAELLCLDKLAKMNRPDPLFIETQWFDLR